MTYTRCYIRIAAKTRSQIARGHSRFRTTLVLSWRHQNVQHKVSIPWRVMILVSEFPYLQLKRSLSLDFSSSLPISLRVRGLVTHWGTLDRLKYSSKFPASWLLYPRTRSFDYSRSDHFPLRTPFPRCLQVKHFSFLISHIKDRLSFIFLSSDELLTLFPFLLLLEPTSISTSLLQLLSS